jgi:hypothetical protein
MCSFPDMPAVSTLIGISAAEIHYSGTPSTVGACNLLHQHDTPVLTIKALSFTELYTCRLHNGKLPMLEYLLMFQETDAERIGIQKKRFVRGKLTDRYTFSCGGY